MNLFDKTHPGSLASLSSDTSLKFSLNLRHLTLLNPSVRKPQRIFLAQTKIQSCLDFREICETENRL